MTAKTQILKYIQDAYDEATQVAATPDGSIDRKPDNQHATIREIFDGMSTGTARIVIEKEMDRSIGEAFDIDYLENQGRYYLARIVRHDGTTIQRLLVDKQTGNVRMVGAA